MKRITIMVGDIRGGSHGGSYGIVFLGNESITFSLKHPVWKGKGARNLHKGDWVTLDDIKMHGDPPRKRAGLARLATDAEIAEALKRTK